jgi:hypothetical protein
MRPAAGEEFRAARKHPQLWKVSHARLLVAQLACGCDPARREAGVASLDKTWQSLEAAERITIPRERVLASSKPFARFRLARLSQRQPLAKLRDGLLGH